MIPGTGIRQIAMEKVFIYWDNSNIFISAQEVAMEREGDAVRYRVRLQYENLLELAQANRDIGNALAVGSIPPALENLWANLRKAGVNVQLQERGAIKGGEQGVDQDLQNAMLRDGIDHLNDPGIIVLITGDGGFREDLERLHERGWRIEVLSWRHSCNGLMREWAEENGVFVALDDFYESITYLAYSQSEQPTHRPVTTLDLSRRMVAGYIVPVRYYAPSCSDSSIIRLTKSMPAAKCCDSS